MSIDPTVVDQPSPTRAVPQVEEPVQPTREPLDPEHRAWLIGLLAGGTIFALAITAWVHLSSSSNVDKAQEKTEQVGACTKIEDGTAALACVVQIDE